MLMAKNMSAPLQRSASFSSQARSPSSNPHGQHKSKWPVGWQHQKQKDLQNYNYAISTSLDQKGKISANEAMNHAETNLMESPRSTEPVIQVLRGLLRGKRIKNSFIDIIITSTIM